MKIDPIDNIQFPKVTNSVVILGNEDEEDTGIKIDVAELLEIGQSLDMWA